MEATVLELFGAELVAQVAVDLPAKLLHTLRQQTPIFFVIAVHATHPTA